MEYLKIGTCNLLEISHMVTGKMNVCSKFDIVHKKHVFCHNYLNQSLRLAAYESTTLPLCATREPPIGQPRNYPRTPLISHTRWLFLQPQQLTYTPHIYSLQLKKQLQYFEPSEFTSKLPSSALPSESSAANSSLIIESLDSSVIKGKTYFIKIAKSATAGIQQRI